MNATDQIKAWGAPVLAVAVVAMAGFVFSTMQARIGNLEGESADYKSTLAVIAANQGTSAADRQANQLEVSATLDKMQSTTDARLGKIEDAIGVMSSSVSVLTAIQQRQEKDLGRGTTPAQ